MFILDLAINHLNVSFLLLSFVSMLVWVTSNEQPGMAVHIANHLKVLEYSLKFSCQDFSSYGL